MKTKWKNITCDWCGRKLNNPHDLVIYNKENGEITDISFRHGNGQGCDDRRYFYSRHVCDGIDDLIEIWRAIINDTDDN